MRLIEAPALPTMRAHGIEFAMHVGRFAAILSGVLLTAAAFAEDEATQPSVVSKVEAAYPAELAGSKKSGQVIVDFTVDKEGMVRDARVVMSTNPKFEKPALDAIRKWRFKPGVKNGRHVNVRVRQPITFIFEESGADSIAMTKAGTTDTVETLPVPIEAPMPEYTTALLKSADGETVLSYLWVTDTGRVSAAIVASSPDKRLDEPTIAALKHWKFKPGESEGKATSCVCAVPIEIKKGGASSGPVRHPEQFDVAPVVSFQPAPRYPFELVRKGISGSVIAHVFLDRNGVPVQVGIAESTNRGFESPSIDALRKWRFRPATANGSPVISWVALPMNFGLSTDSPDHAGRRLPPKPKVKVSAVHPFERAVAGEGGSAEVHVVVGADGKVHLAIVTDASEPEFGMALAAAIDAWEFEPATEEGKPATASMRKSQKFKVGTRDSAIDKETGELLSRIRGGKFTPANANELDVRLTPKFRAIPIYPTCLLERGPAGSARVEVIVDKKGRAVLPRIVEASEPEFGWAAATAVQRWRFDPPTVGGKPVEVKVVIPMRFTQPELQSTSADPVAENG